MDILNAKNTTTKTPIKAVFELIKYSTVAIFSHNVEIDKDVNKTADTLKLLLSIFKISEDQNCDMTICFLNGVVDHSIFNIKLNNEFHIEITVNPAK